MPDYLVTWQIELEAASPAEAAARALVIQRDATSIATVFSVQDNTEGGDANPQVIDLNTDAVLTR